MTAEVEAQPTPRRLDALFPNERTPMFHGTAFLGVLAIVATLITRNAALIGLVAPFLSALAITAFLFRRMDAQAGACFSSQRVNEGDMVDLIVDVSSTSGLPRVEVEVELSDRLEAPGRLRTVGLVKPGTTSTFVFPIEALEWGVASVERIIVRGTDRLGMFAQTIKLREIDDLRIGLAHDRQRSSLDPDRFRRIAGSHTSTDRGEGLELADIRAYQPGDSLKSINWRISNRRKEPWVNLRHPDRSSTVILLVDAHARVHTSLQQVQRKSVAAALSLVQSHLDQHDRVGLMIVGHTTAWLPPRVGRRQLFRISDALVAVGNTPEASLRLYRPRAVSHIPNDAIVLAVSPLLDPHMVRLLGELRSHGNPVSVLRPKVDTPAPPRVARARFDAPARQLASLEQDIGVFSLRERGVAIAEWEPGQPLEQALNAITFMRRTAVRSHAW